MNKYLIRNTVLLLAIILFVVEGGMLQAASIKRSEPANIQEAVIAKSALLVDVATGTVLFSRNSDSRYHPASTTKLMTALLAYEKTRLQGNLLIEDEDTRVEPSHVPLKAGEQVSISDLVHAMLISSDNDAAMALARHVSGNVPSFAALMNKRAAELGCRNTFFTNPHGLPDPREYTTCEDLMRIFYKVLEIPELREIASTRYYSLTTQIGTQKLRNHNKLLGNFPGMGAAKTGWTYASRHTYAASCVRDGRELRLVILNSANKWADAVALFKYGFTNLPEIKMPAPMIASTTIPESVARQVSQTNATNSSASTNTAGADAGKKSTASTNEPATVSTNTAPKKQSATNAPTAQTNSPATNAPSSKTNAPVAVTNAAAKATPSTNAAPVRPVAQKITPHVVKRGDTLSSIAKKYGCSVEDILLFNSFNDIDHLKIGQVVYVPLGLVKVQAR